MRPHRSRTAAARRGGRAHRRRLTRGHERDRRALEVRLPRVRRARRTGIPPSRSCLPVLRHRVAGEARRGRRHRRARPRQRRCAGSATTARGWQAERRQVKCQSCNAISVFDPKRQAQNCEFCGSAQLVPYEEAKPAFRPESVLPFKVSEPHARDRIRAWYGKLWLAPDRAQAKQALTDTVRGVYLPYWTFDAQVDATWTAEAGHYYYTTETYSENGRTQTRQVQHVRWEPAAGQLSALLRRRSRLRVGGRAPAGCCAASSRFRRRRSSPTTPATSPAGSSSATRSTWSPRRSARATAMDAKAAGDVRAAGPRRHLPQPAGATPTTRGQTFKHILAPVWLLSYTFGAQGVPVRDQRRDRRDPAANIRRARGRSRWSSWRYSLAS